MKTLFALIKRNSKLFFKDKGTFFSSLITPIILLILYATFLASVYKDSFTSAIPAEMNFPEAVINATVGGELFSSLLAVSCVTVAFCSNLIMVMDKVNGSIKDLFVTPVKKSTIASGYYLSTLFVTLIVCFIASIACLIYIACVGWYISFGDFMLIVLDIFLLCLFGTALSSIVNCFLKTQGQMSAVGTIVSAGYGFICGAYMPISSFGDGLQKVISFLPGTYGTSLIRNHALAGAFREMNKFEGFPVESIKDSIDCNLYFFGNQVSIGGMYAILIGANILLIGAYILIQVLRGRKARA